MKSLLRANTLRLEGHTDIVQQEQRVAQLLVEQLCLAQRYAPPEDAWRYEPLIQKARKLERYFSGMTEQMSRTSFELAQLSVEINRILTDAGEQFRNLEK